VDWISLTEDGVLWIFLGNGNKLLGAKNFGKFVSSLREFGSRKVWYPGSLWIGAREL